MKLTFHKEDLLQAITDHEGSVRKKLVTALENALIEEALILTRGNQTQAARMLGMSRGSVQQKYMALRKAGVKA